MKPKANAKNRDALCEPLIDAKEAARLLDCCVKTVKYRAAAGEIPGIQIGNRWKFRASVLDEWLKVQLKFPSPLVAAELRKEKL